MKNKILKNVLFTMTWLAFSLPALALPGDPPLDDDPVEPVPIDNWMLLLTFAGIFLGIYLVFKSRRKAIT